MQTRSLSDDIISENPFKAVRKQTDGKQHLYSEASAFFTGTETLVRQEDADSADINVLLSRYGVSPTSNRTPEWNQEIDYSIDLQTALGAAQAGRDAHAQMPPELRRKYPTWGHMVAAIESGEYEKDLQKLTARQEMEAEWAEREKNRGKTPEPPKKEEEKKETPKAAE